MIVFTGRGSIANEFCQLFEAHIFSFRNLNDCEILKILSDTTVLIHNSANLNPKSLDESIKDNFLLTQRIVSLILQSKRDIRFVFLSSMSVLENQNSYKLTSKMNEYAFGKYLGEVYTLLSKLSNKVVVRFSTIFYGDPSRDGLSAMIFKAVKERKIELINEGKSKRDFIPISIASSYLKKVADLDFQGEVNIASGVACSFAEVARMICSMVNEIVISSEQKSDLIEPVFDFSRNDIIRVGLIDFDLMDYIGICVKKFSE